MDKNNQTPEEWLEKVKIYRWQNLKRLADANESIARTLEKMNWNIGFKLEIAKRKDPALAQEIAREWEKKKNKKE